MSELRDRMIRDMTVRGFARRTHTAYIAAVVKLAKHYHRSPDQLTNDEVQTYLAHLINDRKLSWSTCSQAANAFRFLYHVTLGRPRTDFHVPLPKQPQKLPEILSREEVWRLLTVPPLPRHRLLLMTVYAAGLRVSEAIALKVSDIDADRLTIRIEQGKGAKDRYVPLAARLLQELRAYWNTTPPRTWLFANRQGTRPIDVTVAQKTYTPCSASSGTGTSPRPCGISTSVRAACSRPAPPWICRSRPPPEPWRRRRPPPRASARRLRGESTSPISSGPTAPTIDARIGWLALSIALCTPSRSAAPLRSAAIAPSARRAAPSASPTTPVATATARNANTWLPSAGLAR